MSLDFSGLLGPQQDHSVKLLNSLHLNGIAVDTSQTGVGKTYCASWIAKQYNHPIIVICPKIVISTWEKVLTSFGIKAHLIVNYEKIVRGGTPHLTYKPNVKDKKELPRFLRTNVHFPINSLIIVDECHKCGGTTSLTSGLIIALKKQHYTVLGLSATLGTNPIGMRSLGFALNLHNLYDWKAWCIESGAIENEAKDYLTFDIENSAAQKKMADCHFNLFVEQKIGSRLTREMMGVLFPDNKVVAEAYDLGENNPKIQAVYAEMEYELARLEESTMNYSAHVFAIMMMARRKSELLKLPLIMEMIEESFDEGNSIVVFLNFTESIETLAKKLSNHNKFNNKVGFIYGEQTYKQRLQDIADFQSDKKRVLLCNLRSGGAALSLHDLNGNHPRESIISPSFSAVDILQAIGRIFRQGSKSKCYQRIVYAAGCIEEHSCVKVQDKLYNLSCLNDGDLRSGINFFK